MLKKGNDVTDLQIGRLADGTEVMAGRSTLVALQIPIIKPWGADLPMHRIEFYALSRVAEPVTEEPVEPEIPVSYSIYPLETKVIGALAETLSKNRHHSTLYTRVGAQFKLVASFTDGKEHSR